MNLQNHVFFLNPRRNVLLFYLHSRDREFYFILASEAHEVLRVIEENCKVIEMSGNLDFKNVYIK